MGAPLHRSSQSQAGEPVNLGANASMARSMSRLPLASAFDEIAPFYDDQPNPLLSLEERFLPHLLPDLRGLDVLDVGCGTGRWMRKLAGNRAHSITGLDSSPEMLKIARKKVGLPSQVYLANCIASTLLAGSADVTLASFVLSYVEESPTLLLELSRLTRAGGVVVLSDVHPQTERIFGWKRTFRTGSKSTAPTDLLPFA